MERINDVIVRENVANCVNVAEELKQSDQTFKIKLENFSSAWQSANAAKVKTTIDNIINDFDIIINNLNIVNSRIDKTANDIQTVNQSSLN